MDLKLVFEQHTFFPLNTDSRRGVGWYQNLDQVICGLDSAAQPFPPFRSIGTILIACKVVSWELL